MPTNSTGNHIKDHGILSLCCRKFITKFGAKETKKFFFYINKL